MARLYDRIMAGQAINPSSGTPMQDQDFERQMARAVVVMVDNVAEMTMHERGRWDPVKDFPNVAPPLDVFWMESRRPAGMDWAKFSRENETSGMKAWGALIEGRSAEFALSDSVKAHPEARWELRMFLFMHLDAPGFDAVVGPTGIMDLAVSQDGAAIGYNYLHLLGRTHSIQRDAGGFRVEGYDGAKDDFETEAFHSVAPLLVAISFMHCKNVERREVEQPAPLSKKWQKKHGRPLVRYHVLDIDPMRKVLRDEGKSEETGLKKALHICRGHFATYTEDAPLFGRITGTFWKPQHVRGSAKHGAVVKDYRVKAPTQEEP